MNGIDTREWSIRKQSIPYVSQWFSPEWNRYILDGADPCSDPDWNLTGFKEASFYRFWSWKICGLACLRSVLLYRDKRAPCMAELLEEALDKEVYKTREDGSVLGLIYRPFTLWVKEAYGLEAKILEHTLIDEALSVRKNEDFLILSVSPEIKSPAQLPQKQGGHLVLVTEHTPSTLTFNNPSGITPFHCEVEMERSVFSRFYASRGIHIKIPT